MLADTAWFTRALWNRWILLSGLGYVAYALLDTPFAGRLTQSGSNIELLRQSTCGLAVFLFIGYLQGAIVESIYPGCKRGKWMLATAVPYLLLLVCALLVLLVPYTPPAGEAKPPQAAWITLALISTVGGAVTCFLFALPQWWVLGKHAREASNWLKYHLLAGLISGFLGSLIYPFSFGRQSIPVIASIVFSIVTGLFIEAVGGVAFFKMEPLPESKNEGSRNVEQSFAQ